MENTFKTSAFQTGGEMNREQLTAAGAGVTPVTVPPAVAQNTHLSFASPAPRTYPSAEGGTGTGAQVDQTTQLSFTSPSPSPRPYQSAEDATVTGAQNRRLSFDSPPPRPYPSAEGTGTGAALSNVNVNSSEQMTKKRGRPRKNGPDGIAVRLTAAASASAAVTPPQGPVSSSTVQPVSEGGPSKKPRGRPPGSCKKQRRRTSGSAGSGITITPHFIVVKKGEDVAQKIVSFTRQGSRAVNIISANGVLSKVVLVGAAPTDETATHEGQLDILSLSGSFEESIIGDEDSWTGAITISVAREGLVFGGSVIGDLTAASTVQIILGTIVEESERVNSPPADGRPGSPLNHGDSNNANMQGMPNMP